MVQCPITQITLWRQRLPYWLGVAQGKMPSKVLAHLVRWSGETCLTWSQSSTVPTGPLGAQISGDGRSTPSTMAICGREHEMIIQFDIWRYTIFRAHVLLLTFFPSRVASVLALAPTDGQNSGEVQILGMVINLFTGIYDDLSVFIIIYIQHIDIYIYILYIYIYILYPL